MVDAPASPIATQETVEYRELADTKSRLIDAFEQAEDAGADTIAVNATDVRAVVDDHDRLWLALSSAERRNEKLVRELAAYKLVVRRRDHGPPGSAGAQEDEAEER